MQVEFTDSGQKEKVGCGTFKMVFKGISEPIEVTNKWKERESDPDFVVKRVASFEVMEGDDEGKVCDVWFNDGPLSPRSKKAKVIQWITGAPLPKEGGLNTDDLIGVTGTGVVGPNSNGNPDLMAFQPDIQNF